MVEVAVELIEAMVGRQHLVPVAQVVLAELGRGVAEVFQHLGHGDGRVLQPLRGAGHADLGQPRARDALAGDEGRAAGGAALFGVIVGEKQALVGQPVDVGRVEPQQPLGIGADVGDADVVAEDDHDVGFLPLSLGLFRLGQGRRRHEGQRQGHGEHKTKLHFLHPSPSLSRCCAAKPHTIGPANEAYSYRQYN